MVYEVLVLRLTVLSALHGRVVSKIVLRADSLADLSEGIGISLRAVLNAAAVLCKQSKGTGVDA